MPKATFSAAKPWWCRLASTVRSERRSMPSPWMMRTIFSTRYPLRLVVVPKRAARMFATFSTVSAGSPESGRTTSVAPLRSTTSFSSPPHRRSQALKMS